MCVHIAGSTTTQAWQDSSILNGKIAPMAEEESGKKKVG